MPALLTGPAGALERFRAVRRRSIPGFDLPTLIGADPGLPREATVLVTGGTGCIGRRLLELLAAGTAWQLVSVARRPPEPGAAVAGVRYLQADVRERGRIADLVAALAPQLVIHLAAQRDPGLAEREVRLSAGTNIAGTRNVLEAAGLAGVGAVAIASTGKALRYYTDDVYAGSKKAGEWLLADAARRWGYRACAARFTHVVENSIIAHRIEGWLAREEEIVLHAPHILLYVQSALEAAQLLLLAVAGATAGSTRVLALHDLQWPIDLDQLADGLAAERCVPARIRYSGFPAGYQAMTCPGTYGPTTFASSPLINALEVELPSYRHRGPLEEFVPVLDVAASGPAMDSLLGALGEHPGSGRPAEVIRARMAGFLAAQLTATARAVRGEALNRVLGWMAEGELGCEPSFLLAHDLLRAAAR